MENCRLPQEGRKDATKPAHAVPLASARQHLDVETQAGEHAVEGPPGKHWKTPPTNEGRAVEGVENQARLGFPARGRRGPRDRPVK